MLEILFLCNKLKISARAIKKRLKTIIFLIVGFIYGFYQIKIERINYIEKDSFKMNMDLFDDVKRMDKRQFFYQVLSFGMILSSASMIWKGLMVVTDSESPIVVVLSGYLVCGPGFCRGDLLFLTNYEQEDIGVGEIIVFKVEGRDIPIVHRVLKLHKKEDGTVKFLTKGDNNSVDDRGLYAPGQFWLTKKDIVGRARGYLPYVGIVTIIMNEYPKFKYAVLACMGFYGGRSKAILFSFFLLHF